MARQWRKMDVHTLREEYATYLQTLREAQRAGASLRDAVDASHNAYLDRFGQHVGKHKRRMRLAGYALSDSYREADHRLRRFQMILWEKERAAGLTSLDWQAWEKAQRDVGS
ncbi:MAG: hypothetical protein QOI73_2402 [Solirubrobacteraceae bacterium]|nr:hypothetical protein [Solirubrobacteraceae bacterium]